MQYYALFESLTFLLCNLTQRVSGYALLGLFESLTCFYEILSSL